MSPSVFRPLLDRSTSGKRSGPVPAWEPDPLLSGAAVGQGRPDERAAASGVRATETFEQLDMPISGPEGVPEPEPREASARHCGHGAASRFAAAEGPAFEPLSMECLTGVPRSETVESAFGDGLEFELDPLPEPGRSDDESGIDIDEFGDLEVDPESGSGARIVPDDSVDTANPLTETSEVDDRPDGEPSVPGPVAAAVFNVDIEEPEAFVGPPIPMIRESEHLEEIEAVRKTTREAAWAEAHHFAPPL